MTGDDEIRGPARQALYRIGFAHAIQLRPWSEICARGRLLRRRRVAAGVAGIAMVLTGAGAANALVVRGGPAGEIRSDSTVPSTTTSAAEPSTIGTVMPTSEANRPPPPPPEIPVSTEATTTTTEPALPPYDKDVSFTSQTTTDTPQVTVGGDIVLHASLTNTGAHAFETVGYGSLGVACDQLPETARDGIDARVGVFLDYAVLQPGETRMFTVTLTAPDYVGHLTCGVGFAYHGDAFAAGPTFGPADATVDVGPAPDTTTTATPPVATTSTTDASADA